MSCPGRPRRLAGTPEGESVIRKRAAISELSATAEKYFRKALCTEQQKERDRIENSLRAFLAEYHSCSLTAATPAMLAQYMFFHHARGRTTSADGVIKEQAKASTLWGVHSHLKMLYDLLKTQTPWSEEAQTGNPARSARLEATLRGYANEQIDHGVTTNHAVPLTDEDLLLLAAEIDAMLANPGLTFSKRVRLLQLNAWLMLGYWASDRSVDVLRTRWEDLQLAAAGGQSGEDNATLLVHHAYTKPERGASRPANGKEEARLYTIEAPPSPHLARLGAQAAVQRLLQSVTQPAVGALATGWIFAEKYERNKGGGYTDEDRCGDRPGSPPPPRYTPGSSTKGGRSREHEGS